MVEPHDVAKAGKVINSFSYWSMSVFRIGAKLIKMVPSPRNKLEGQFCIESLQDDVLTPACIIAMVVPKPPTWKRGRKQM
jgi:hypothetical protein